MRCSTNVLPVGDPFVALRREFERNAGLSGETPFGAMTISETESWVRVELDVPGASLENLEITVRDGKLLVSGRRNLTAPESGRTVYADRQASEFRRILKLHKSVDPQHVDAVLEDGVLRIQLQRRPEVQPQRIEIRSAHSTSRAESTDPEPNQAQSGSGDNAD